MAIINGNNLNNNLVGIVDPQFFPFIPDRPDTFNGFGGNDTINALGTNDTLNGGSGNDILNGNAGNDWIDGGFGLDVMNGGIGIDTLDVTFWGGAYSLNMNTGLTNFAGEFAFNFENVNTGAGNDNIVGTAGSNIINTGLGNDAINAGSGNDTVNAGGGNNVLNGEAGSDRLTGGAGIDRFNFTNNSATGGVDTIFGFNAAFDSIGLNGQASEAFSLGLSFTGGIGSTLSNAWYFEGAGFNGNGAQLSGIFVDTVTGNLWYNPTSGVVGDSYHFATVNPATIVGGVASLSAADFVLI